MGAVFFVVALLIVVVALASGGGGPKGPHITRTGRFRVW